MKKLVSILLCCLMMISIFSASAAQVYAATELSSYFAVTDTELVNDKITYTIAIKPSHTKLVGLSLKVKYDGDMLEVDSCKVGDKFGGISATGADVNEEDTYSIIWTHATGINIASSQIVFAEITFKMIGEERDVADVAFLCEEFDTDDGKENDHYKPDGQILFAYDSFFTLSSPVVSKVYSTISDLVVEWGAVEDADSYNVYRKTAGSDWACIAEGVTDTRYIDNTIATATRTPKIAEIRPIPTGPKIGNATIARIRIIIIPPVPIPLIRSAKASR